ncbi:E3 SUMO-protein ligase ZBED1-like [Patiria miniata]|uniref:HAT C-terminal dimerisation domain-containing protein n=1 Tax=Patiria miniata TaxID=46514 RepID=A0A914AFI3_PATMI|nr:E3 SUMO-protein ligase ZBED1-like [Patiria miniata]
MIERILEQAPAIRRLFAEDRAHSHLLPTWQDISVLEAVNKALKPVAAFTDIMSGEEYVTVSSLVPMLHHLQTNVLQDDEADAELTADIKRSIMRKMDSLYDREKTQELLHVATLLDPRYRADNFKEDRLQSTKATVVDEITEQAAPAPAPDVMEQQQEDQPVIAPNPPPQKRKLTLGNVLGKKRRSEDPTTPIDQRANVELERYLSMVLDDVDGETDPLMWWRDHQRSFPLLAKLSRKYLCICATSSPSERLFSTAGHVVSPQRSLLKPDKVNMLVFLAKNL